MKNTGIAGIVVDYTNTFADRRTGEIYVEGGEKIASAINDTCQEIKSKGGIILASKELHPEGHISFETSFSGKESILESFKKGEAPKEKHFITLDEIRKTIIKPKKSGLILPPEEIRDLKLSELVELFEFDESKILSEKAGFNLKQLIKYLEENGDQAIWPEHSKDNDFGSEYHKDFNTSLIDREIKKGFEIDRHPFSAFGGFTLDGLKSTAQLLKEKGIKLIRVMGLAIEYCDLATAIDGLKEGFDVEFDLKATAGVTPSGIVEALEKMRNAGVKILD